MISRLCALRKPGASLAKALRFRSCAASSQMPALSPKAATGVTHHMAQDYKFSEGKNYENFECERIERVAEFGLTSYTFRHKGTGTELWHLERNDPNNVFSVNFRTTPYDSSGLPHILEHTVLCGSERYPVRDPFFKMLTRSVATFMNAMTGPDYTLYPFSSMNETDYRNLQKIYLDAVFKPKLAYLDFLQEGWRLEHSDLQNPASAFAIKGVVYNEMKGAFSENSSLFGQSLFNTLLPDNTYGYVSGGAPSAIPELKHNNLVDFHRKYYHPSNARIFSYGSFDLAKTLAYVNAEYLSQYERLDNAFSRIPNQQRWSKPLSVHVAGRYDKMGAPLEKQNQIAIALLMADITNIQETFVLQMISELLVRGPNAAFYKSLIEPNFSGGYNQATGYDAQIKDTYFSVGLQDLKTSDFEKFEQLFDSTIKQVIDEGFDAGHVESVLHNIELSLKHQSPKFGLGLLMNSTPLWNHEGDVVNNLRVTQMIGDFRRTLQDKPTYLQEKLEQYFGANNTHRLKQTMSADEAFESKTQAAEAELLAKKVAGLKEDDKAKIYATNLELAEAQKAKPNIELLPCLALSDVRVPPKTQPVELVSVEDVQTQVCQVHTNDVTYFKSHFSADSLTRDEVLLLPLLCNVIDDMGTEKHDFREFDKLVQSKTGGFSFKMNFAEDVHDAKSYKLGILVCTHALDKNAGAMFDLTRELFTEFKFDDVERLSMLIESYMSNLSVGIAGSGHLFAMQSSAGLVTDAAQLKAQLSGVEHITYMRRLVRDSSTAQLQQALKELAQKLFDKQRMRVALNTSGSNYASLVEHYARYLQQLPAVTTSKQVSENSNNIKLLPPSCQQFVMDVPVNYCAKSFFAVPYTHADHPRLRVLAKLLSAKYLLPVVREQNGAYGAGARLGSDGIFSFYSYRDPNSSKTLAAFDDTYEWLQAQQSQVLDEQMLFESKLGVLQGLDAPISPGSIGIDEFAYGVSQKMFQEYRARMLSVSMDELKAVMERYFKHAPANYGKCILGPKNPKLEEETKLKWKTVE